MTTKHKYKFGETPVEVIREQVFAGGSPLKRKLHAPDGPWRTAGNPDLLTMLDALVVAFECAVECSPVSSNSAAQGYHKLRIDILAALGIEEA